MNISVVGLGKLGAVLAAVAAGRGHHVTGVDIDPAVVNAVNTGVAPVQETGLDDLLARNVERISATTQMESAVACSDITFVVVPTPSKPDGMFSLEFVLPAVRSIASVLRNSTKYHLVVVSSTVMPGAMESSIVPAMEHLSRKKCGLDFGVCYNPEFIALGSVIRDMLNPDMVLIGESDPVSGGILERFYGTLCAGSPPLVRTNFVNAELAKLALNTFVTTKISYANMLAEICERLPGADASTVCAAIGLDSRVGAKYLKGAFGYGGPCFPRDNKAFLALSDHLCVDAALPKATDQINSRQVQRLAGKLLELSPRPESVSILGMSYKPNTHVIEESQGVMLAQHLLHSGVQVVVYDPAAMPAVRSALKGPAYFASTMEECAAASSVLVIATPWEEFKTLHPRHLRTAPPRPLVVDWWRILRPAEFLGTADYLGCGLGMEKVEQNSVCADAAPDLIGEQL
ncbi:MAG TPA: nucleotide sugar dehydrogenase [Candidatus Angelobacter sp.]|jgi:UDPglucose 6-dehydrogenase|nr:nucleotide sugar dehydrogenase [Candidatus Angelobacter sp.]